MKIKETIMQSKIKSQEEMELNFKKLYDSKVKAKLQRSSFNNHTKG